MELNLSKFHDVLPAQPAPGFPYPRADAPAVPAPGRPVNSKRR